MKVLMVNSFHYLRGGADKCYLDLSRALRERGIEVVNFSMHHPQNLQSEYSEYFVSQVDYPTALGRTGVQQKLQTVKRAIYSTEAKEKISRIIHDQKPDLVHIHGFIHEMSTSILPPLKKFHLPVIQTLHDYKLRCPNSSFTVGDKICEKCKGHRYYNAVLQRCKRGSLMASVLAASEMYFHDLGGLYEQNIDLFITPSEFLHNKMREHGVKNKIDVIPNFVDLDHLYPSYEPEEYSLYVGRLAPGKGLEVLLQAYERISSQYPLYLAGDGELRDALEHFVKDRNMQHVHFLGHLDTEELGSYLRRARFLILPSVLYENNPLSILEAYASGTAVVGSNLGGIIELVEPNQAGLLFEAGNVRDLVEKIDLLFSDREMAIEMGQRGRAQVEANNSLEKHIEKTVKVYDHLVGESSDHKS